MRRLALLGATALLLVSAVPTFAATGTGNLIERATLTSTTLHGGATLARIGNGTAATLAVKFYRIKPDTKVTVTVWDKTTTTQIVVRETFKSPAAAAATHRTRLTKAELAALNVALKAKDQLWVTVTAAPTGTTAPIVQVSGEFKAVK